MEAIKRKWFFITLAYIFTVYFIFVVMLKGSQPVLYYLLLSLYVGISAILFLGNIIGFPGLVLHAFFKKEDKALPFYEAAYKLGAKSAHLLSAYGLVLLRKGKSQTAQEIFESALKYNRNYFYTRILKSNLAICKWKLGQPQAAYEDYLSLYYFPDKEALTDFSLDHLDRGLEINPAFTQQDFVTMGYLALLVNQIEAAFYFSHLALLKQDNYAAAYDNLGQIYYRIGEKDKAKEAFHQAIDLKPNLIDSLYYLARIALEEKQRDKAKDYGQRALNQPFHALNTISQEDLNQLGQELDLKPLQA